MTENYPRGVETVASALIVNKEGKILLIKSHKWGDILLVSGGHIEPGERIMDAAKREGEEETGLKLEPLYCVNMGELINSPDFHRRAHLIYFHYVCKALTEDVKLDEKELKDFIWVEPKKALELPLRAGIDKTIENYTKGIRFEIPSDVY